MINDNISKLNRLALGVVVAALIAASCGTDDPAVVEQVEPVPVETTEAPTPDLPPTAAVEEPEPSEEAVPTVDEGDVQATTTTAAEQDSETAQFGPPGLVVDPVTVSEGLNTFTLQGSGFRPNTTVFTLLCPLSSDVSEDTPEDELTAAMASVTAADCDLSTSQSVTPDDEGSFTTERDAIVIGNFMWVASDSAETQAVAAAVFMEPSEELPAEEPELASDKDVDTSVDSIAARTLAFLAGELGVPVSELALTDTEPMTWGDTSLGCPKEGYAYAQVVTPGYRFTFSHGTASHDVHSNEQGIYFVRPVDCYDPSAAVTTVPPEPEPEPTVTTVPEEPEPEPTVTTVAPEPEPEPTVTTVPAEPEPTVTTVPAEPEPTVTTVPEEPEPEVAEKPWEQETEPEYVWTPQTLETVQAGTVPEVWPLCGDSRDTWTWRCTPPAQWQRGDGTVTPGGQPEDLPRAADRVQGWARWCYNYPNVSCSDLLFHMSQALDYLGADRACVMNVYTDRVEYLSPRGAGADTSYARNSFGWHLCSTVIDPLVKDLPSQLPDNDVGYRLSDTPGITLAERCRVVLTTPFPDIELESRGNDYHQPIRFGQDCDAWAASRESRSEFSAWPQCWSSMVLAEEWMEHVHGQHERYFRPKC